MDSHRINKQTSNLNFVRAMFTSKGMELPDMGQNVLWAERRSRRGWPRPARSTTGYALCSFLNMADRHGLAGGGGSSARGRTASGKLYLPNGPFTFAPEYACGGVLIVTARTTSSSTAADYEGLCDAITSPTGSCS